MNESSEPNYQTLLKHTLFAVAVCFVVVVVCYFSVDRPVAFFMHDQGIEKIELWGHSAFRWLTYPPPEVQNWSPLVLALVMVRRAWGPLARWQWTLFVACLSLIVADEFRESLGEVCRRDWPETWRNNPSLIGDGAYGFHFFGVGYYDKSGYDTGSFPSGHSARILGFATVWWIAIPRSRIVLVVVGLPMLLSLILLNFHFVSDVIAGSTLGAIVGTYAARLAHLEPSPGDSEEPSAAAP